MTATLTSILELTEAVQSAIDEGDWLRASEIEARRRSMLEAFFAASAARGAGLEPAGALEQLRERNQRLIGEVQHHRRRVLRDASMIRTGQIAVDAYGASCAET